MAEEVLEVKGTVRECLVFEELQRIATACEEADVGEEGSDVAGMVGDLTSRELREMRVMHNPPPIVRRTLEVTFLILNAARTRPCSPPWPRVQRMLADADFLPRMLDFDVRLLQESPSISEFVAAEYFGALPSRQGSRRTSRTPTRRLTRSFTRTLSQVEDVQEMLTFQRVFRASRAAAALFRWSTSMMVQALDPEAPVGDSALKDGCSGETNSDGTDGNNSMEEHSDKEQKETTPTNPPVLDNEPVSPQPDEIAAVGLVGSRDVSVTPEPKAQVLDEVLIPSAATPGPLPAPKGQFPRVIPKAKAVKPAKPKPPPEEHIEPDRHFEAFVPFDLGNAGMTEDAEPALQNIAATVCMRRRGYIKVQLVTCPDRLENDILAERRLRIVQDWFAQQRVESTIVDESRVAGDDPGVVCQILIGDDWEIRDYYLGPFENEDGEVEQPSRRTVKFANWLEETFKCCKH